jgi:hypothetical protein
MAALFAGRLAGAGDLLEVSRAARALPAPAVPPRPTDLILDGLARLVTDGSAAAAPALRHVVSAFTDPGISAAEGRRWGWFAQAAASALWDDDAWRVMLVRQVRLARDAGALDQLAIMLGALGTAAVWSGDFAAAASLIAEADAVCAATRLGTDVTARTRYAKSVAHGLCNSGQFGLTQRVARCVPGSPASARRSRLPCLPARSGRCRVRGIRRRGGR